MDHSINYGPLLSIEGIYEETVHQLNKWREIKQKTKQIPMALVAVTAVAVSAVTGGVGAFGLVGMMGAMASASFSALCSTVATGGDLEATAKAVVSKGALLNLASSVAKSVDKDGLRCRVSLTLSSYR